MISNNSDIDKLLIDYIDLKSLYNYRQTCKYLYNLIDNDEHLKDLLILLKKDSTYNKDCNRLEFIDNRYNFDINCSPNYYKVNKDTIVHYILKLFTERKTYEALKITDFYREGMLYGNGDGYCESLFFEIIGNINDFIHIPHVFEEYFRILPEDIDQTFITYILEGMFYDFNLTADTKIKIMKILLGATIMINKTVIFDYIINDWIDWKSSIERKIINNDELIALDQLQKFITEHYIEQIVSIF